MFIVTQSSCTKQATYYYSCICGEHNSDIFIYGDLAPHSFTNYVYNNDATYSQDGTKTAKCNNCDATDTITDIGTKLSRVNEFKEQVANVFTAKTTSERYSAIRNSLIIYELLNEQEKYEVDTYYLALQNEINEYNELAETANNEMDTATSIALASISGSMLLAAALYLAKKKFLA